MIDLELPVSLDDIIELMKQHDGNGTWTITNDYYDSDNWEDGYSMDAETLDDAIEMVEHAAEMDVQLTAIYIYCPDKHIIVCGYLSREDKFLVDILDPD